MKKISIAALLLSLLAACTGGESEPDPFEMLSGSWQKLKDDSLTDDYLFIDDAGERTTFIYHAEEGCYTDGSGIYPHSRYIGDNTFVAYGLSGKNSNVFYTVSDDGNYLHQDPPLPVSYLKSDLTIDFFVNYSCE